MEADSHRVFIYSNGCNIYRSTRQFPDVVEHDHVNTPCVPGRHIAVDDGSRCQKNTLSSLPPQWHQTETRSLFYSLYSLTSLSSKKFPTSPNRQSSNLKPPLNNLKPPLNNSHVRVNSFSSHLIVLSRAAVTHDGINLDGYSSEMPNGLSMATQILSRKAAGKPILQEHVLTQLCLILTGNNNASPDILGYDHHYTSWKMHDGADAPSITEMLRQMSALLDFVQGMKGDEKIAQLVAKLGLTAHDQGVVGPV
jgi:hypothetical protein